MKLHLLLSKSIELNKFSDELLVREGSFKKHLVLPRQVAAAKMVKAMLEGQYLLIYFKGDHHGQEKE